MPPVIIQALAGAGKTTALARMARAGDLYLAFNRSLAQEAEAKVGVRGRTFHSLALEEAKKRFPHLQVGDLDLLQLRRMTRDLREAAILLRGLHRFLLSEDAEPELHHMDPHLGHGEKARLLGTLRGLWRAMMRGELPMPHDGYLRLWQGSQVVGRRVLVDEAQDLSPPMLRPLAKAGEVVAAGDPYQQIYAWRGAVNALEKLRQAGAEEVRLSRSYRFGPQIARFVRRLTGLPVEGLREGDRVVEEARVVPGVAVVFRTNTRLLRVAELLVKQGIGVEVVGGLPTGILRIARAVKAGLPFREVMDASQVEAGLKPAVRLIGERGPDGVLRMYRRIQEGKGRGVVVLSTVHRAKGLEWDHVVLGDDFKDQGDPAEEMRLRYVAATRARQTLDVGAWFGKALSVA